MNWRKSAGVTTASFNTNALGVGSHTITANYAGNGNFNAASLGSIKGTVWNDVNADGFRAAGDPGLGGWTVFLDLDASGNGHQTLIEKLNESTLFLPVAVGAEGRIHLVNKQRVLRVTYPSKSGFSIWRARPFSCIIAAFTPSTCKKA